MFLKLKKMTALAMCLIVLNGCASQPSNQGSFQGGTAVVSQVDENTLVFSDLPALLDLMGQSEDILKGEDSSSTVQKQVQLWNRSAAAEFFLKGSQNGEKQVVSEMTLQFPNWNIWEAFILVADCFSGPIQHGSQNDESKKTGEWYLFDAGENLIRMEEKTESEGIEMTVSPNPNPGFQGRLILEKEQEESSSGHPVLMLPALFDIVVTDYSNGVLTVMLKNRSQNEMEYTRNLQVYCVEEDKLVLMEPVIQDLKDSDTLKIKPGEDVSLSLDLRIFGKVLPGKYMAELDGKKAFFTLVEEVNADTP